MKRTNLLLPVLMAIFVFNVKAQIVYTDIVPDGQPAGIDFNQDNTNEFDITTQNKLGDYIEYFAYGADNNIHAVGSFNGGTGDSWDVPSFVAQGFVIDASNNWEGQGDAYPNGDFSAAGNNPTIIANTDQYMAVKFNLGGANVYYGWVRVNIDAIGNVTYKDYAYNATPNTPINAGDMGSVSVTSITVQGQGGVSTITTAGGTLQMVATVLPTNATNNTVTWSVTNGTGSATISATGLLTATGDGTVTVTATANDGSNVTGSTVITISNQNSNVPVTSITVQGQGGVSTITTAGGTLQMVATVLPTNATDNSVTWSVANVTGSATIDANGLLTAVGDGIVTVIAVANDGTSVTGSTDVTISNQTTGINEESTKQAIIYPNPTTDFINISSSKGISEILVRDLSGRLIKSMKVFEMKNAKID
ncbi:MAG: hypothetical protein DSY76_01690, partial [Bacteroidetes bacterium]